jgi:hypothetical protein
MKQRIFFPLITFSVFVLLHLIVSQFYPNNSWGGCLIFYFIYLPTSLIISTLISEIKSNKLRSIFFVSFLLGFIYLFLLLFPTIDEFNFLGIEFN